MATKTPKRKTTSKSKKQNKGLISRIRGLSRKQALFTAFVLVFVGVGVYQLYKTFATTNKSDSTWFSVGYRVRYCESGHNYLNDSNRNSSASGAWQFIDGTWKSYAKNIPEARKYSRAVHAPPEIQDRVAYALFKANGFNSTASWSASYSCWKPGGRADKMPNRGPAISYPSGGGSTSQPVSNQPKPLCRDRHLYRGVQGEKTCVYHLQGALNAHGYSPGELDGIFGQKTEDALKRFQASPDRGGWTPQKPALDPDGATDPATAAHLCWNGIAGPYKVNVSQGGYCNLRP